MKKRFLIPACVLSVALIGWVIFAMLHPELSFPWDSRTSGILYGLLADTVVLLFILAFCKKWTLLNILSIVFLLGAVFCLVQSVLGLAPDGQPNRYLPLANVLNCIALFLNLAQVRKNRKNQEQKDERS